jgi:large subunit ribosomal protein L7/L12
MPDLNALMDRLSSLTVIEAVEVSKMLEEKWGVSAAAPVVVTQVQETGPVEQPAAEQTEFTIILSAVDPTKKISVIKEVRGITGLGLKEAKDVTEAAGPDKVIKSDVAKADAEAIKTALEAAGATVILR